MQLSPRRSASVLAALLVLAVAGCGRTPAPATLIVANDNRAPAGVLKNDTLTIRLEARSGQWQPEGENGRKLDAYAWAEEGRAMQDPGPLVRVTEGTEVRASLRNTLPKRVRPVQVSAR